MSRYTPTIITCTLRDVTTGEERTRSYSFGNTGMEDDHELWVDSLFCDYMRAEMFGLDIPHPHGKGCNILESGPRFPITKLLINGETALPWFAMEGGAIYVDNSKP